jgi:hypothetical protein
MKNIFSGTLIKCVVQHLRNMALEIQTSEELQMFVASVYERLLLKSLQGLASPCSENI